MEAIVSLSVFPVLKKRFVSAFNTVDALSAYNVALASALLYIAAPTLLL